MYTAHICNKLTQFLTTSSPAHQIALSFLSFNNTATSFYRLCPIKSYNTSVNPICNATVRSLVIVLSTSQSKSPQSWMCTIPPPKESLTNKKFPLNLLLLSKQSIILTLPSQHYVPGTVFVCVQNYCAMVKYSTVFAQWH